MKKLVASLTLTLAIAAGIVVNVEPPVQPTPIAAEPPVLPSPYIAAEPPVLPIITNA